MQKQGTLLHSNVPCFCTHLDAANEPIDDTNKPRAMTALLG